MEIRTAVYEEGDKPSQSEAAMLMACSFRWNKHFPRTSDAFRSSERSFQRIVAPAPQYNH